LILKVPQSEARRQAGTFHGSPFHLVRSFTMRVRYLSGTSLADAIAPVCVRAGTSYLREARCMRHLSLPQSTRSVNSVNEKAVTRRPLVSFALPLFLLLAGPAHARWDPERTSITVSQLDPEASDPREERRRERERLREERREQLREERREERERLKEERREERERLKEERRQEQRELRQLPREERLRRREERRQQRQEQRDDRPAPSRERLPDEQLGFPDPRPSEPFGAPQGQEPPASGRF
jgi:hypothetical protein